MGDDSATHTRRPKTPDLVAMVAMLSSLPVETTVIASAAASSAPASSVGTGIEIEYGRLHPIRSVHMSTRLRVFASSVGMKILIGVTGLALFLYLVVHIIGNVMVFFGPAVFN